MRPLASLSHSLLARKGQARPAMRAQTFGDFGAGASIADDLGWNDMGVPERVAAPSLAKPVAAPLPPVLVERAVLTDEVARIAPATVKGVPTPAADTGSVPVRAGKSAFTLRLPADRHLRLRLASAVMHRSAQAIVTEALDALLSTLPEVEELAARCTPDRPDLDQLEDRP